MAEGDVHGRLGSHDPINGEGARAAGARSWTDDLVTAQVRTAAAEALAEAAHALVDLERDALARLAGRAGPGRDRREPAGAGPRLAHVPRPLDGQRAATTGLPLTAQLLGPLRVTVNETLVEEWSGSRGRSLLAYLLTHRRPWPTREVLTEVFWPGSSMEAGRNSLNVAVHGLRRAFRKVTDAPVIVLEGRAYRLHPRVRLWSDVDEFEDRLRAGHRLEAAGDPTAARTQYEHGITLYRDDFLTDDPYEDWSTLPREQLRLAYLEVLDRLGILYFQAGWYAPCVDLCRRLLDRDPCREDAHRLLMRCFSRQGQPHLSLLQFRSCVRVLATELGVEPGPETIDLYNRIRAHRPT